MPEEQKQFVLSVTYHEAEPPHLYTVLFEQYGGVDPIVYSDICQQYIHDYTKKSKEWNLGTRESRDSRSAFLRKWKRKLTQKLNSLCVPVFIGAQHEVDDIDFGIWIKSPRSKYSQGIFQVRIMTYEDYENSSTNSGREVALHSFYAPAEVADNSEDAIVTLVSKILDVRNKYYNTLFDKSAIYQVKILTEGISKSSFGKYISREFIHTLLISAKRILDREKRDDRFVVELLAAGSPGFMDFLDHADLYDPLFSKTKHHFMNPDTMILGLYKNRKIYGQIEDWPVSWIVVRHIESKRLLRICSVFTKKEYRRKSFATALLFYAIEKVFPMTFHPDNLSDNPYSVRLNIPEEIACRKDEDNKSFLGNVYMGLLGKLSMHENFCDATCENRKGVFTNIDSSTSVMPSVILNVKTHVKQKDATAT